MKARKDVTSNARTEVRYHKVQANVHACVHWLFVAMFSYFFNTRFVLVSTTPFSLQDFPETNF